MIPRPLLKCQAYHSNSGMIFFPPCLPLSSRVLLCRVYKGKRGFKNDLSHEPGVLSMARTMYPDSAGSQFFIMHADAPHLDGAYASFGKVTEGIEVVDKIASVDTDWSDHPTLRQIMKKVTVETFGEEYPEPEKTKER
ncbi:MAG: peptidylprolyl isomerase [Lachnospiraceae bacterium]|nr:peptidylprolyl isomerase [Lachnospiraceae bacterium]